MAESSAINILCLLWPSIDMGRKVWVRTFNILEELRQALLAFQKIDNDIWLIERHGCLSPAEYRTQQFQPLA